MKAAFNSIATAFSNTALLVFGGVFALLGLAVFVGLMAAGAVALALAALASPFAILAARGSEARPAAAFTE